MSRFEIAALESDRKIFVGWDPMMQSFFFQVWQRDAEAADLLGGGMFCEITLLPDLRQRLLPYAILTPEAEETLRQNKYGDR